MRQLHASKSRLFELRICSEVSVISLNKFVRENILQWEDSSTEH